MDADLVIVGAGPAGAVMALLAARAGLKTCLVDGRGAPQKSRETRDIRNYALVRGSWRLLRAAGLEPALLSEAEPLHGLEAVEKTALSNSQESRRRAAGVLFGESDLDQDADDLPLGYMVEAHRLTAAVDAAVAACGDLTVLSDTRFASAEAGAGAVRVTFDSGLSVNAGLLVGADGAQSSVRTHAGIRTLGWDYPTSVLSLHVGLSRPHEGIARQVFSDLGTFALLPLKGQRANIAWYMPRETARAMEALAPSALEAEMNAAFASFAGPMTIEGERLVYPLRLVLSEALAARRTALVGDAVRRISPIAGQGLNSGLKDVAALLEAIVDTRRLGLDIGSGPVLTQYQRTRRFDSVAVALGMDAIMKGYTGRGRMLDPLRAAALAAAQGLAPLRRAIAGQVSSEQAHLPRLIRGLPL